MGMDYSYVGSATYSRFNQELSAVAKVFGGIKVGYSKFIFPDDTNTTLVRWFNDIYSLYFTSEETRIVWESFKDHPEIEEISDQIWRELETLVRSDESWCIT